MPIISIHALRVEGDPGAKVAISYNGQFLSTPSGWRATCPRHEPVHSCHISIHALRVEGDPELVQQILSAANISIHALRVEGDCSCMAVRRSWQNFYPRPPGGGRLYSMTDFPPEA